MLRSVLSLSNYFFKNSEERQKRQNSVNTEWKRYTLCLRCFVFSAYFPNWTFTLEQPGDCAVTFFGMPLLYVSLPLCVYPVLSFLPLFGIFPTGPSPWSSRVAVPLPFLVCLCYSHFQKF